jgi:hypothetical protein
LLPFEIPKPIGLSFNTEKPASIFRETFITCGIFYGNLVSGFTGLTTVEDEAFDEPFSHHN